MMFPVPPWLMLLALVRSTLPSTMVSVTLPTTMVDPELPLSPRSTTSNESEAEADAELVRQAEWRYTIEQLLVAARVLRKLKNPAKHLKERHWKMSKIADILEQAVEDFMAPPFSSKSEWQRQSISHGSYETSIYYKIESGGRLSCRIETAIPRKMIVPILSVLNESSLYPTWIPSWTRPFRLGIRESTQLVNDRRGHQVIQIKTNFPWPMAMRDTIMDVIAVDDIDENGCIIVKMQALGKQQDGALHFLLPDGFELPAPEKGSERMEFDGSILFRTCPTDHPSYEVSRRKHSDDLVLLQYKMDFDAGMAGVPRSFIQFITRVAIGMIWGMLLKVAEEVKRGARTEHVEIIRQNAEFYKWLEDRCQLMLDRDKNEGKKPTITDAYAVQKEKGDWTLQDVLRLAM